ncbi:hypothetical protein BCR41DRAFT_356917, partial [Lobosporangium transversale]
LSYVPWSPGYVYLSEHALVDILWANEDTKQLLERILPLNNPSKTAMYECVQGTKGVLIQALFCDIGGDRMVRGYQDKVSLQSQDKDLTRFKLKGTISTNGLVLNLLAYDTTQTKRQQQSDVDEEDPSQELELSQGFLNTTCSKAAGRCPSANTTTIVGCDPGIVNALTFSSLDPHNPNLRQTVKVRSRFLYLPKREKGMIEVESAIPVFGRDTYNEYFQWMNEESQTQTGSTNLDVLQEFYESRWHPEKKMGPTKGSTSYVRLRVQRVLKMLGDKGVLVVGLGSFESIFFDRDAVGAENIARIGLAQIERQERPAKYKPTEESPAPAAKRARR